LTVGDLDLITSLRMIGSEQFVSNSIFMHEGLKKSIAEMCAIITDDYARRTEERKDICLQEFDNHLVVICSTWYGFDPLGYLVHCNQNVGVPK